MFVFHVFWKYMYMCSNVFHFSQIIPQDNDDSFQLFLQYADEVHASFDYEGMWLIMIRNVQKYSRYFKTSMLSVYVSMERWTLWDFKDFWMRICMQVMHVEESHNIKSYSCFLPVICDSACVFGLIFQDIHRRPQDSAWICVRAWWHWWMYPQIWRIRVRKGFQGSVF